MTEVTAWVFTAGEHLVTNLDAQVHTLGVATAPHFTLDRAADFLTVVLVARLQLVAHALALDVVDCVQFFLRHQLLPQCFWVVDLEAGNLDFRLSTLASLLDQLITPDALVVVALLRALVASTWQKAFAECLAHRDGFGTSSPLAPQKFFNRVVTTRAVNHPRRVSLAGGTLALVAELFA